jgi:hypothetical protein
MQTLSDRFVAAVGMQTLSDRFVAAVGIQTVGIGSQLLLECKP